MSYDKRKRLIEELAKARGEVEGGKLSRRDFNSLMVQLGILTGFSLAQVEEASAWVGTRMRKPKRSSSTALTGRSLRFDHARGTYLTRTNGATPGNQRTFTIALWMKRSLLGMNIGGGTGDGFLYALEASEYFGFVNGTDRLVFGTAGAMALETTAVYRDTSAWMHVMVAVDTNQAIASERIRMFVNGERVTAFTTSNYPAQGTSMNVNNNARQQLIGRTSSTARTFDGYISDFYLIDGAQLAPWSFIDIDPATGQLVPKTYSGSYGLHGFYLPFNDATSTTTLGYDRQLGLSDSSKNNWSLSGTATTDCVLDSPTNNFCTWNVIGKRGFSSTITSGALSSSTYRDYYVFGNMQIPETGKWYFEVTATSAGYDGVLGLANATAQGVNTSYYVSSGTRYVLKIGGSYFTPASGPIPTNGTFMVAVDMDNDKYYSGFDGVWANGSDPVAGTNALNTVSGNTYSIKGIGLFPAFGNLSPIGAPSTTIADANFGQGGKAGVTYSSAAGGAFTYAPPTGFKALSTANLPAPAIAKPGNYFQVTTYTGNGSVQRIGELIPATSSYQIARSLRFNPADSAYLHRTPGAAGNRRTWTLSMWVKRATLGTSQALFYSRVYPWSGVSGTDFQTVLYFDTDDTLKFGLYTNAFVDSERFTTRTFKNTTEWIHVLVAVDTTLATAADRVKLYVNGAQETSLSSSYDPAQNYQSSMHDVAMHHLGNMHASNGAYNTYFSGYMTEVHAIDGQQLTPSSFGETNATSGEWVPKAYAGSYGTRGFYLNFSDNSNTTATTLGKDSSGNGNNWTPVSFSIAADANNDSLTDSPTSYGTDSGGTTDNSRGNYATLGALPTAGSYANATLSNGGLEASGGYDFWSSFRMTSGKWYYEGRFASVQSAYPCLGVWQGFPDPAAAYPGHVGNTGAAIFDSAYSTPNVYGNGGNLATVTCTTGSYAQVAFDADTGKLWLGANGVWANSGNPSTGANPTIVLSGGVYYPGGGAYGTSKIEVNFGQRPFAYSPPTGFKCLNTNNLATVDSRKMTGTPDLVWIKSRSAATDHSWYDTTRGVTADLANNLSAAQTTQVTGLTEFRKTGFTLGSLAKVNTATATYAAWMWKKSVAPGFDIQTFTGNGGSQTFSHNLGVAPAMFIYKAISSTGEATVYHRSANASPQNGALSLSSTAAWASSINYFANVAPTNLGFSVGPNTTNGVTYIAYLWAEVPGFSRFGGYTGNGSADGPFVWCGFKPALVIVKRTDTAGFEWMCLDNARDRGNPFKAELKMNDPGAEGATDRMDFLSNGFKLRTTSTAYNASGATYIFIAFAEAPFKYATAR